MRKYPVIAAALLAAAFLAGAPALADNGGGGAHAKDPGTISAGARINERGHTSTSGGHSKPQLPSGNGKKTVPIAPPPPPGLSQTALVNYYLRQQYLGVPIPGCAPSGGACPSNPRGPGAPVSAAEVVQLVWTHDVPLPKPGVEVPPGRAITGHDACMILSGPTTVTFDEVVFGFPVHIDASSTYDVDWGSNDNPPGVTSDRYTTGYTGRGGYCDEGGTLRHQYTRRGPVTIVVTQRWTAHWTVGSDSGVIADQLATTTTLADFPVVEIQAVVTIPAG